MIDRNQTQNPDQPSMAAAHDMAIRMWQLLGEKTKWRDDVVPGWRAILLAKWQESGMGREDFEKIIVWALTENEFTVENLRLARNPAKSLFVNQWENVELFYDAAMAGKKARLRKSWRNGACLRCDEREAQYATGGWCSACSRYSTTVDHLVEAAYRHRLVFTMEERTQWIINSQPNPDAPYVAYGEIKDDDVRSSIFNSLMEDKESAELLGELLKRLGNNNGKGFEEEAPE